MLTAKPWSLEGRNVSNCTVGVGCMSASQASGDNHNRGKLKEFPHYKCTETPGYKLFRAVFDNS